VLSNCGVIDPESLDDYLALDGYSALELVLQFMTPDQVIDEMSARGFAARGRGLLHRH
jgi:NADH-quinone oxidoreductase subunit F